MYRALNEQRKGSDNNLTDKILPIFLSNFSKLKKIHYI